MKLTTIIAAVIKILLIVLLMRWGLSEYNQQRKSWDQPIEFWLLIWIPLFAGYESLLSALIKTLSKKKPEAEKDIE